MTKFVLSLECIIVHVQVDSIILMPNQESKLWPTPEPFEAEQAWRINR